MNPEPGQLFQPSLREGNRFARRPGVETPGCYHTSLRDYTGFTSIRNNPQNHRKIAQCNSLPDLAAKRATAGPASPRAWADSGRLLRRGRLRVSRLGCASSAGQQHAGRHRGLSQPGSYPIGGATAFAGEQGIPLEIIATDELDRPEYARNDSSRCFHCKDELFTAMEEFRARRGFDSIAYGVNLDDQGDFRPGQRPRNSIGLRPRFAMPDSQNRKFASFPAPPDFASGTSPLPPACPPESSMDARSHVKRSAWSSRAKTPFARSASASFASAITGISYASKSHAKNWRGALTPEMASEFTRIFKALGFKFVTLDLEGFRSGSMNTLLAAEVLTRGR